MATIQLKRAYDAPASDDGYRILVDRVWPRGKSKATLKIDTWLKEVAPSSQLRKWFDHDPKKFDSFSTRYKKELKDSEALATLRQAAADHGTVTLVYGAKDETHNQAVVLKELLSR